ncbi:MAG: glycosyltransferase family 1 protein [Acidihalobacter sp.]|uniref:glycosyltransferase family 4 protein n=1 Tax=Acidihalobacter sp. TaxID=1872108 RepID=UPI00307DA2CB
MSIVINSRVLGAHTTGVQRYLNEVEKRLPVGLAHVYPRASLHGISGHVWEQAVLPFRIGKNVLWSPSNSGPLTVSRQVVTIHDLAPLDHPEWFGKKFSAWYQYLVPRLVRRVAGVLVDSEFTKERLIASSRVSGDKIQVALCGVDDRFVSVPSADGAESSRILSQLDLPAPRYILSVGSLEPRKNIARLLQAWRRILPELDEDVSLVLSGAKGKSFIFQDIPELSSLPPRVHLVGYVEDAYLPALYAGAEAFVYPSVYEGFGLPPLEAMASGTPVVAGNVASLPEVVGEAGLLVDPYDADEIGTALLSLLKDSVLREKLSEQGRARARMFSWQRTADLTWEKLLEVADM